MRELRGQGYSNQEIARKIGRCYATVLKHIGKQDVALSRLNMRAAQKVRRDRDNQRRLYTLAKTLTACREAEEQASSLLKQMQEANRQAVILRLEARKMAKEVAKHNGVTEEEVYAMAN